mmetsp:Transcript_21196/g.23601  ORF Transcript_21196/g.23601 Transcript_21196/m.23601 type:complete len:86 (+) Transcript_21196:263-520(+)
MNATDPTALAKRKDVSGSHTAISYNRGRPKKTADAARNGKYNSVKRGRVVTATSTKINRQNTSGTSVDKRKRRNIPKYPAPRSRK